MSSSTPSHSPADCVYKDLCLDTGDPERSAAFWAPSLGLEAVPRGDTFVLQDGVPGHTLWLNRVPEPKTVKNRVHVDVHVAAVVDLVALGATVLDDRQPWTVLADPEGAELCAFVRRREELPRYRLSELSVDCRDADRLAQWWADRFGVPVQAQDGEDFRWLADVPGMPWEMVFAPVPEPKTVRNRMHWDVVGTTSTLLAAGATLVRARGGDRAWDVLADPEGNEFCVFPAER